MAAINSSLKLSMQKQCMRQKVESRPFSVFHLLSSAVQTKVLEKVITNVTSTRTIAANDQSLICNIICFLHQ